MITSDSMGLPGSGGSQVKYWDLFFRARNGRAIEWYSDWTDLQGYLAMLVPKNNNTKSRDNVVKILVAGCGNSELSAHMYDVGWHNITNVDFSKVVIAEMLRLHVRSRPHMRWQVMDMTHLQVTCYTVPSIGLGFRALDFCLCIRGISYFTHLLRSPAFVFLIQPSIAHLHLNCL